MVPTKIRGRYKEKPKKYRIHSISFPFSVLLVFAFLLLTAYSFFVNVLQGSRKDFLQNNLGIVATSLRIYNNQMADFVSRLNSIVQSYYNTDNVFLEESDTIEYERKWLLEQFDEFIANNPKYDRLAQFFKDTYPHREELMMYFGKNVAKNYLIILQNTSESRPNGGFFGSFAYVQVSAAKIKELLIIDSYLGNSYMPDALMDLPSWSHPFYGNQTYGWIGSNKFGFTNIDGHNIIQIFNKTFNASDSRAQIPADICSVVCGQELDGVIFVKTDIMARLLPGLRQKLREREFMNATVDLRRGAVRANKKEFYLSDSKELFLDNASTLIQNFITQFNDVSSKYSFGVYIPTISPQLNTLLTKYNFTTIPNNHTIYARDTNRARNKSSEFITKHIEIRNAIGDIMLEQENNNHIDIKELDAGSYTLTIDYSIAIPNYYKNFIYSLAKQNNINLRQRERGILVLEPTITDLETVYLPTTELEALRWTKSQLYFPENMMISAVSGDRGHIFFTSPFGNGLDYITYLEKNHDTKRISIDFDIHPR